MSYKPVCFRCDVAMEYHGSNACDEHEDCIVDIWRCPECDDYDENHNLVYNLYSDDDRDDLFLEKD